MENETLKTYYQLDGNYVFTHNEVAYGKPHLAVCLEPPQAMAGQIAVWRTVLDPVASETFGDIGTGSWDIVDDNRKAVLFSKLDGTKYEFTDGAYKGLGLIPAHLTELARPTPDHVWKDNAWWIDPTIEKAAQDAEIKATLDARIQAETHRANAMIAPLQDAVELEIATEKEQAEYTEWRRYRVLLNRVTAQPGYPLDVDFPVSP